VVLATIVVPAGAMNKNAKLVCVTDWAYTNSASVKTLSMDWDGQNISGVQATTSSSMKILIEIQNKNSLTSQTIHNSNTYGSAARVSKAANTAGNINIDLKCMWSAAALSETITLLGYSFWCYPGTV
jgi:LDH2 family malate/lactate/ureidoglycolate dehydrogenase